jgi:DNA-binding NtrC family response regulator
MEHKAILIVENDEPFARTLAQALRIGAEEEFEVTVCNTAEQASQELGRTDFDLMIADHHLPGQDGLSLIKKAAQSHPEMETVFMTGSCSREVEMEARQAAGGYLGKPFDMLDLLLMVRQALSLPAPTMGEAGGESRPIRILVLEDDDGLRRIYQKALGKANAYYVDLAATLEEARRLLDSGDYDILISDMRIGRDRATDLLKEYKARFESEGTRVVMCSAFGQYRHLPDDVDHFLEKPIALDVLVSLVGELAEERRANRL